MEFTYDDRITLSNIDFSKIEFKNPEEYGYYDIANELLSYTKRYLTTEYQAEYILNTLRFYS